MTQPTIILAMTREDFASIIGEGIHTGLRKGTDALHAHDTWSAISDDESGWSDAINFFISGLEMMYDVQFLGDDRLTDNELRTMLTSVLVNIRSDGTETDEFRARIAESVRPTIDAAIVRRNEAAKDQ